MCGSVILNDWHPFVLHSKCFIIEKMHWSINNMICINKEKAHCKGSIHRCGSADNIWLILVSVAQDWQSPQKLSFLQWLNQFIIIITEMCLNMTLYYPVANIEINFHHLHKKTRHDNKYILEQYENNINSVWKN